MQELVSIVIVNWNNKSYLKRCINSILNQTYKNLEVIFVDNDSEDGSFDYVDKLYDDNVITKINTQANLGYAAGSNYGIKLSNGEFVLIMNPDVVLDKDFVLNCIGYINTDESIAAINGKLLKYDFENDKKLNIIDSAGIIMFRSRRCIDRGQNEEDNGQYENTERVFGVCGAAAFYRRSALEEIKFEEEYFDEDFFAYKEDVDLSWRLNLYGYKCMYYSKAIAYHGRGMGGSRGGIINFIRNREKQSEFLRGISFRNHYLMLIKNETRETYNKDRLHIWKRFVMFMGYSLIWERFNFKYIKYILELKSKMITKKSLIKKNVSAQEDIFSKIII